MGFLIEQWLMMMRTKPQYISVLGRKRSSIGSAPKNIVPNSKYDKKVGCMISIAIPCCSIVCGTLLVLFQQEQISLRLPTMLASLVIAAILSVFGGLCVSEYITLHHQEVPSIYSCCYQNSSEVLAFLIGWFWILSQSALVACICKILTFCLNQWTEYNFEKLLEHVFFSYAAEVPSALFILGFTFVILTGVVESTLWYYVLMPFLLMAVTVISVLAWIAEGENWAVMDKLQWDKLEDVEKLLSGSSLCILLFSGPQSLLRIPASQVQHKIHAILGPLNAIISVIAAIFAILFAQSGGIFEHILPLDKSIPCVITMLMLVCLCVIGLEACHPLHFITEDMATDGLLFRSLSKKWKPFCLPIVSPFILITTVVTVSAFSIFLTTLEVLYLSVVSPLLIYAIVPCIVLYKRYQDNTSWQYEPMYHTTSNVVRKCSRSQSQEFQYVNSVGFDLTDKRATTTCLDDVFSDSSSDTDIDAAVKQYKDQESVANMVVLEDPIPINQAQEPTPSSSFRAKAFIAGLALVSLTMSVTLNIPDIGKNLTALIVVMLCMVLSTLLQGLLLCLPQNADGSQENAASSKMPWIPGIASLLSSCLLVHCLTNVWKVIISWFMLGFIIYFVYGIRSSTAASSFYHIKPAQIALRPMPSYGNNCITQIVPSQRKSLKTSNKGTRRLRNGKV